MLFVFCAGFAQEKGRGKCPIFFGERSSDLDFSFMRFRSAIADSKGKKCPEDALFAMGEYYFLIADYRDCIDSFGRLLKDYPNSRGKLFAIAYLLNITKKTGQDTLAKSFEKNILTSQRMSFLFRKFKTYKYKSPLERNYKAVYYIDRIEFYVDGELFEKVSY